MRDQIGQDRLLDRLVLDRRLDHQIRLADLRQGLDHGDPAHGRLGRRRLDHPARGLTRQGVADRRRRPRQPLGRDVVQPHRIAAHGRSLGDADAHLAGADDGDCLDRGHAEGRSAAAGEACRDAHLRKLGR